MQKELFPTAPLCAKPDFALPTWKGRVLEIVSKSESADDALTLLRAEFDVRHDWGSTTLYDQIWEHPEIIEHNKTAHILNQYFYTLYAPKPRTSATRTMAFECGRIGNTALFIICPKDDSKTPD